MTHAHHFPAQMSHVLPASAVLDDGRFVVAASCGRSPFPAIAVGFSTATTASPSAGIPRCSSAPSDALDENGFRTPSINTPGFVAAALLVSVVYCLGVDFSDDLTDLDWGSWEGSLPESSSLGGDRTPLRGAFIHRSAFSNPDSRTHCRKDFINFVEAGVIFIAAKSRQTGPLWPAKMAHSFTAADSPNASNLFPSWKMERRN